MARSNDSEPHSRTPSRDQPLALIDLKAQQNAIRPQIDRAIARVLDHGQYIMGPEVAELERQLAVYTGARHALSCSSGTDALLMAMMAKSVGRGDAILCPGFTYTATPETIVLLGATPVFIDVCADTFNVDPAGLEAGLAAAKRAGLKVAGIVAVDLFGHPAAYDEISAFADAHKLWVLADAAQSFGAGIRGRTVGTLAEITTTSFFPAKPLGCYGDGGAIFTDDDDLATVLRSIRLHGKGADKYDVVRLGINGRLDTLQAAILIEKLAIFPGEVAQRNAVAERYSQALAAAGVATGVVPTVSSGVCSVWAQYTLKVDPKRRDAIRSALKTKGVPTEVYYPRPLNHQPAYESYPVAAGGVRVSETLSSTVLSLPMHPYLTRADQDRVMAALLPELV